MDALFPCLAAPDGRLVLSLQGRSLTDRQLLTACRRHARALTAAGIGHLVHYPIACHQQAAYADAVWPALPIAEQFQHEVLSLPIAPYLSRDEVQRVADVIRSA